MNGILECEWKIEIIFGPGKSLWGLMDESSIHGMLIGCWYEWYGMIYDMGCMIRDILRWYGIYEMACTTWDV